MMNYADIANRLGIEESTVRDLSAKGIHRIVCAGDAERFAIVVKLSAAEQEKNLRHFEEKVTRTRKLAHAAELAPDLLAEIEQIERSIRAVRVRVARASVYIRCGSIECRPEKWVFNA